MNQTSVWIYVLYISALLLLVSCSGSRPLTMEPATGAENPAEYVGILERDVDNARQNRVDVLVPEAFARAENHLNKAKKALEQGGEISKILDSSSRGREELKTAEKTMPVVTNILAYVIESRDFARKAGAEQFKDDYADAEKDFLNITKDVENDRVARAKKKQAEVSKKFRVLELRAIKDKAIGDVEESLRLAEKAGAKKIAPETLALARLTLQKADQYITDNRYDSHEISQKADAAVFQAERLGNIMELSEEIRSMTPEESSLFIEEILHKITGKVEARDMRNEGLDLQVESIVASIGALQKDQEFLEKKTMALQTEIREMRNEYQSRIEHMSREIADLELKTEEERTSKRRLEDEKRAVKERLASERQFNQLYSEVQDYFEPHEAEVYKQGQHLVIRLKDIIFPVGKSYIMPDNYELLGKVQRAVRTFGDPDVLIQGHTDSTGSKEVNAQISKQRALAVLDYLLSKGTITADKIQADGYGSERPLASNETPEGRAINRRIDVVIKPLKRE